MESALEVMLQISEQENKPFEWLVLHPEDFVDVDIFNSKGEGNYQTGRLCGFCQLLARGWLDPGYPNSHFYPSKALIEQMRERDVWKDLPNPPTIRQRFGLSDDTSPNWVI
ncbi:MAG: hypothetical protein KGL39_00085 [Patescibacteria group bacterium]|nr:hypothetical protein [Patescibacteria group bacterium]